MSSVTCVSGSILVNDQCLTHCPPNYVVLNTDATLCVNNVACPPDTTEVDGMTCQKSYEPAVNGSCVQGAQYTPGTCYYPTPCPAPYLENGLNCLKRTIARTSSPPHCSNVLFSYDGTECRTLSIYGWFTLFVGMLVFVFIGLMVYNFGVKTSACEIKRR
jgi:hypothetical protein